MTGIFDFVHKRSRLLKTLNVKVLEKTSCTLQRSNQTGIKSGQDISGHKQLNQEVYFRGNLLMGWSCFGQIANVKSKKEKCCIIN